ncbi:hypothetical protein [Halomonas sp. BM-2019]|uniref:hypothetical protein n=1 Tax=Halomonas sp. BM-2019 TaxID=2811227 RepID=UPI001B3C1C23|nr:MAG: hypothetical protein J5F18_13745 [Halomonas sp. BM-2019]
MKGPSGHPWPRFPLLLALSVLALLLWSLADSAWAGWLFPLAWVLATQLIAVGSLEAARLRRRAWLGQYLREGSSWHRRLRGGAVMIVRHQLFAALLALVLLVKLRGLPLSAWTLLLAGAIGLCLARAWLRRRLVSHVIAARLPAVSRRLLVAPVAGLLALALVGMAFWRPQPWLVGLGWEAALLRHLPGGEGGSLLGFFERLAATAEITRAWAMQNAEVQLSLDAPLALLGWMLMLLTQGAVAWAYVRLLIGADALCGERAAAPRRQEGRP